MSPIHIIDYGMANLRSVQKAFEAAGIEARITSDPAEIRQAEKLVLPGVGAFKDAIATLREKRFDSAIVDYINQGRPFLGICLGLQMLFDVGYEDGEHRGLGVLRGKVIRFDFGPNPELKVPHMGWNQLEFKQSDSPILRGLENQSNAYFVHSYHVVPDDPSVIATTTDYGRPFVSSVQRGNIFATQFHPEKSQTVGLKMLANFARS